MIESFDLFSVADCDSSALYNKLKSLHRIEFPADYKLVITYTQDCVANVNFPGEYLTEFVRILSDLDFPTFFVELRTNHPNISRDLAHLAVLYKNGSIGHVELDGDFTFIPPAPTDTFCVLPWLHFYFNPQGQVNPCCVSDIDYPLGDYSKDINFNSKEIVAFRQSMIDGVPVPQCTGCYKQEKNNVISFRQQFNQRFAKFIPAKPTALVEEFKLRYLDIRLSNLCNLKCRMCSGKFSSRIADEDFKLWGDAELFANNNNTQHQDKIIALVADNIDYIEQVYFAGGEPLLNETHYTLLDMFLTDSKQHIDIVYNTNFSMIDRALGYWNQFDNVTVGASIDLMGPAADYVRNGVDYNTLEHNYRKLVEQCPDVQFNITSVLSLYNAFNLCELQKHWITNLGISSKQLSFNLLLTPDYMTLRVLPVDIKHRATDCIKNHILFLLSVPGSQALISQWEQALVFMNSQDDSHLLSKFFNLGDARDQARNQQFELYFPEYQTLREYAK